MDLKLLPMGVLGTASVSGVHGWVAPVAVTSFLPRSTAIVVPNWNTRHVERFRNRTFGCCSYRNIKRRSIYDDFEAQRAGSSAQTLFSLSCERLPHRAARFQRPKHRVLRKASRRAIAHLAEGGVGSWLQHRSRRSGVPAPSTLSVGETAAGGSARNDEILRHQGGAVLALPVLGRLIGNSANLFQVGVLFGTIPTLLAGVVCFYWAYQVIVAGSLDYQSRKLSESIKTCRLPPAKVGPGNPGFVDRPKLVDADALRQEVQSRFNPTLLVHGERGSGKTVAVRLALHSSQSVVHVKLWGRDLARPLIALAQGIIDASGVQVSASAALVVEDALRLIKGRGWRPGGALVPIVVVELDKRCSDSELLGVLLACKRWGDDENLAKFVVEAPSARIARGLPISLSDLRVEGIKMQPLTPNEAQQVAIGCVPIASCRNWKGGRQEDLAKYIVSKVGLGMLDLVRVGFAARNARDPLALHAAVNRFATREARAARGGVTAFLSALHSGVGSKRPGAAAAPGPGEEGLEKRLWRAIKGAAARAEGRRGKNPGLDEVLEAIGVSERAFEKAARGVGPASPLAVDPFSYKVSVRSLFFKDALAAAVAAWAKEDEHDWSAEDLLNGGSADGGTAAEQAHESPTSGSKNSGSSS